MRSRPRDDLVRAEGDRHGLRGRRRPGLRSLLRRAGPHPRARPRARPRPHRRHVRGDEPGRQLPRLAAVSREQAVALALPAARAAGCRRGGGAVRWRGRAGPRASSVSPVPAARAAGRRSSRALELDAADRRLRAAAGSGCSRLPRERRRAVLRRRVPSLRLRAAPPPARYRWSVAPGQEQRLVRPLLGRGGHCLRVWAVDGLGRLSAKPATLRVGVKG